MGQLLIAGCGAAQADAQGRAAWLTSSNAANVPFYNAHGFRTAGVVYLGADDPTWGRPPVRFDVVRAFSPARVLCALTRRRRC